MLVVDASVVVAALTDTGVTGEWAHSLLASDDLAAPHHMPAEALNTLRRAVLAGQMSADAATAARFDLQDLQAALFPFEPFARRIWELHENLTVYDGWYVALAERLGTTLATLDGALARAPGPRCSFVTPYR